MLPYQLRAIAEVSHRVWRELGHIDVERKGRRPVGLDAGGRRIASRMDAIVFHASDSAHAENLGSAGTETGKAE